MTKFVIVAAPRTGSYLLVDLLRQQPGVACHGEAFKTNSVEIAPQYRDRIDDALTDAGARDADPTAFCERLYGQTPDAITGFKVFRKHGRGLVKSLLLDPSIRKVFLSRNPVQSHISLRMAQVTEKWINKSKPEGTKTRKLTISPYNLISHIVEQKGWFDMCRNACLFSGSDFLFLDYADLLDPASHERLAAFLGMKGWDNSVSPTTHKQITKNYPEIVRNWKKLNRFLKSAGVGIDDHFLDFTARFCAARPQATEAPAPAAAQQKKRKGPATAGMRKKAA